MGAERVGSERRGGARESTMERPLLEINLRTKAVQLAGPTTSLQSRVSDRMSWRAEGATQTVRRGGPACACRPGHPLWSRSSPYTIGFEIRFIRRVLAAAAVRVGKGCPKISFALPAS